MKKRLSGVLVLVLSVLLLAGCQAIFTNSLLSFLQRDPSKMSLDQRIYYAEQALASGEAEYIEAAYDALKADAAASNDGDLQLLAAELASALSGLPDLLPDMLDDSINFGAMIGDLDTALNNLVAGLDAIYLAECASLYSDAQANQADLDATDFLMGTAALLALAVATEPSGDVNDVNQSDPLVAAAINLLEVAVGPGGVGGPFVDNATLAELYGFLTGEIAP